MVQLISIRRLYRGEATRRGDEDSKQGEETREERKLRQ